jgi:hypothetical protein
MPADKTAADQIPLTVFTDFQELVVAQNYVLQCICANLPPGQAEGVSQALRQCQEYLTGNAGDELEAKLAQRVADRMNRFLDILGGEPVKPLTLH